MSEVRLIDANALKEEVNHNYLVMKNTRVIEIGWLNEYVIDCMPTIEPEITEKQAIAILINSGWLVNHDKELREKWERPQGKWENICTLPVIRKCSLCGVEQCGEQTIYDNFCPNCGADMRKGGAEE